MNIKDKALVYARSVSDSSWSNFYLYDVQEAYLVGHEEGIKDARRRRYCVSDETQGIIDTLDTVVENNIKQSTCIHPGFTLENKAWGWNEFGMPAYKQKANCMFCGKYLFTTKGEK